MAKKTELGKGIRALLSNIEKKESLKENSNDSLNNIQFIALKNIEANSDQPRTEFDQTTLEELAASIKTHGIIQPITVRKLNNSKYQIISGERRFRASKLAGLEEVPVFIRVVNDQEILEMALIENIQREDLNAIEIAISYARLMQECNLTQDTLSDRVAKKRSTISNYIRLLKLPPEIQKDLKNKGISMGHARCLAGIEDIGLQLETFNHLKNKSLSVRALEEFIKKRNTDSSTNVTSEKKEIPSALLEVQKRLRLRFGTKVNILQKSNKQGKIELPFNNTSELNYILDLLED